MNEILFTHNGNDYKLRDLHPSIPWYKGGFIRWYFIDRREEGAFRHKFGFTSHEVFSHLDDDRLSFWPYWVKHPHRVLRWKWQKYVEKLWTNHRRRWERGKYGFAQSDLWNFDIYFVNFLIQVLPHFLNTDGQSHAIKIDDDEFNRLNALSGNPWGDEENYRLAGIVWDQKLKECIDYLINFKHNKEENLDSPPFDPSRIKYVMDNLEKLWG